MRMIVDIDGTICKSKPGEYENAEPIPERIKMFNAFLDGGVEVIYWTARGSSSGIDWTELTTRQLKEWGVRYTELRMGKPSYDIWIDDKAENINDFVDRFKGLHRLEHAERIEG